MYMLLHNSILYLNSNYVTCTSVENSPMQFNDDTVTTEYHIFKETLGQLGIALENLQELPKREPNGQPEAKSKFNDKFLKRIDDLELELKGFFCSKFINTNHIKPSSNTKELHNNS